MKKIQNLSIMRKSKYSDTNPDRFVGTIKLEDENGSIEFPLSPQVAEPLMLALAPIIVKFSHDAATQLGQEIEKQMEALAHPAIECGSQVKPTDECPI